jgi:hypothetical protein
VFLILNKIVSSTILINSFTKILLLLPKAICLVLHFSSSNSRNYIFSVTLVEYILVYFGSTNAVPGLKCLGKNLFDIFFCQQFLLKFQISYFSSTINCEDKKQFPCLESPALLLGVLSKVLNKIKKIIQVVIKMFFFLSF